MRLDRLVGREGIAKLGFAQLKDPSEEGAELRVFDDNLRPTALNYSEGVQEGGESVELVPGLVWCF